MQVAGLCKRYGEQRALVDISFAVNTGEVLSLIGPNGAGKTTLMEAVAGILAAVACPAAAPRVHVLSAGRTAALGRPIRR